MNVDSECTPAFFASVPSDSVPTFCGLSFKELVFGNGIVLSLSLVVPHCISSKQATFLPLSTEGSVFLP